jgi:hypothetical protein
MQHNHACTLQVFYCLWQGWLQTPVGHQLSCRVQAGSDCAAAALLLLLLRRQRLAHPAADCAAAVATICSRMLAVLELLVPRHAEGRVVALHSAGAAPALQAFASVRAVMFAKLAVLCEQPGACIG